MGMKGWSEKDLVGKKQPNGFYISSEELNPPSFSPVENKKVIGSKKQEFDGLKFDSKIEMLVYQWLKNYGFEFELKKTYEILPQFHFNGEKVRKIEHTPDFYLRLHNLDIILEAKGHCNDVYPYKLKLLKYKLAQQGSLTVILFVHLQKELTDFFYYLNEFKQTGNIVNIEYLLSKYSLPESDSTISYKKRKSKESREKSKQNKIIENKLNS